MATRQSQSIIVLALGQNERDIGSLACTTFSKYNPTVCPKFKSFSLSFWRMILLMLPLIICLLLKNSI